MMGAVVKLSENSRFLKGVGIATGRITIMIERINTTRVAMADPETIGVLYWYIKAIAVNHQCVGSRGKLCASYDQRMLLHCPAIVGRQEKPAYLLRGNGCYDMLSVAIVVCSLPSSCWWRLATIYDVYVRRRFLEGSPGR